MVKIRPFVDFDSAFYYREQEIFDDLLSALFGKSIDLYHGDHRDVCLKNALACDTHRDICRGHDLGLDLFCAAGEVSGLSMNECLHSLPLGSLTGNVVVDDDGDDHRRDDFFRNDHLLFSVWKKSMSSLQEMVSVSPHTLPS